MTRSGVALLVLVGLAACNVWPPPGQGGFAEVRPPQHRSKSDAAAYEILATLTKQLDELRQHGVGRRYPAHLANAELLVVRIQRGLAGGLVEDAEADLDRLRHQLEALSERPLQPTGLEGGRA